MKRAPAGVVLLLWGAAALPGHAADGAVLAAAVERQERAAIRALLDGDAAVNAAQPDGTTALHWAAHHDDLETVRRLLAAGADPEAENRYGVTPLLLACTNGSAPVVEALLAAGADPNRAGSGGETPLMAAARTGRTGPVEALLARGAVVDARERRGQTALMWAAAEGHADVVEVLLRAGADPQASVDSGFTAFFFAVREGRGDVVHALLRAGADVDAAMRPADPERNRRLDGTAALALAVENGHFELAVALLEAGADPNDQRSGFTALHALSRVRQPDRGDADGSIAPVGSGSVSSLQLARALVEHGADVNARLERGRSGRGVLTMRGATPFLLAADRADAPLMRLLVELGADPHVPNAEGSTPLMAAAGLGTLSTSEEAGTPAEAMEAVLYALSLGADVDAVDDNGETAMHGAAYKNLPEVVALLADRGADIAIWNRKNAHGWTPMLIAEGYRPGNFKPDFETMAAIERVMLAAGVPLSTEPKPVHVNYQ